LLLTEYLLQSERESNGVMCDDQRRAEGGTIGFARFVLVTKFGPDERYEYGVQGSDPWAIEKKAELQVAGKGVLGMMHFANYRSPVLLEALGDLLMTGALEDNATQLAARAYLQAAAGSNDKDVAEQYRKMARDVLATHEEIAAHHREEDGDYLVKVEQPLAREIVSAQEWFSAIESNERQWIAEGRDVDQAFAAVYYSTLDETIADAAKEVAREKPDSRRAPNERILISAISLLCVAPTIFVLAVVAAVVIWRRFRRPMSEISKPIPKAF